MRDTHKRMNDERTEITLELGLDTVSESELSASAASNTLEGAVHLIHQETGVFAWLKSRSTPLRFAIIGLCVALISTGVFMLTQRADLSVYPLLRFLTECGSLVLLALLILAAVLRPVHKAPLAGYWIILMAGAALLLPSLGSLLPVAHQAHPASLEGAGADLMPRALACYIWGTIVSLPILALIAGLDRDDQQSTRKLVFVALGAGLFGLFCLQMHCPITHQPHLFLGHATVVYGLVALYILFRFVKKRT